jgi:hypothetical protein
VDARGTDTFTGEVMPTPWEGLIPAGDPAADGGRGDGKPGLPIWTKDEAEERPEGGREDERAMITHTTRQ